MSTVTAHRRHVHVPTAWLIVAVAACAATAVAVAVARQEATSTWTVPEVVSTALVALPGAAVVAKPESLGMRHAIRDGRYDAEVAPDLRDYTRNRVRGTTLDRAGTRTTTTPAPPVHRLDPFEGTP